MYILLPYYRKDTLAKLPRTKIVMINAQYQSKKCQQKPNANDRIGSGLKRDVKIKPLNPVVVTKKPFHWR